MDILSRWWQEAAIPTGTLGGFLAGAKWQKWRSPSASGDRTAATGGDNAPAVTGESAQTTTGDHSPNVNIEHIENMNLIVQQMELAPGDETVVEYDEDDEEETDD